MCPSVENLSYALELLLTSCVPDLKFEHLLLKLDKECAELHPNCHLVIRHELVVREPVQQTGLADCGVSNDDEFEEEVLILDAFALKDLELH